MISPYIISCFDWHVVSLIIVCHDTFISPVYVLWLLSVDLCFPFVILMFHYWVYVRHLAYLCDAYVLIILVIMLPVYCYPPSCVDNE